MQGESGTLRKVKSKFTKLGHRLKRDVESEEADDLPEDSDKEGASRSAQQHVKLKQKLVKLREKFGEDDDGQHSEERAKAKLKFRIAKLSEKLKREDENDDSDLFDDSADDKEKTAAKIKYRIAKLSEKLKRDGHDDDEDDDEDEIFDDCDPEKRTTSTKIKQKIVKITEKLRRDELEDDKTIKSKITKFGEKLLTHKDDDSELFEDCLDDNVHKSSRLKEKFVKFGERLKPHADDELDMFEDCPSADDKSPAHSIKSKIVKLSSKLRRDEDSELFDDFDELADKPKTSVRIKHKLCKLSGKLFENERVEPDVDDIGTAKDLIQTPKKSFMNKITKFGDKLRREEQEDRESVSTEEEKVKSNDESNNKYLRHLLNRGDTCESQFEDIDSTSLSGSEGKNDLTEVKLFEKIGQRIKERSDKVQKYFQRGNKLGEVNRRLKSQIWSSVVTIVLVEGKNLQPMDIDGFSDPYVKFRLGNEKYKSKVIYKSLNPSWLEQFDLHLYDDQNQELELTVWDKDRSKDDYMGKCNIDLAELEREKTHGLWIDVEEGSGSIFLLLTISGTTASETISDLTTYEENPRERTNIANRYALRNTLHNLRDVGHLTVKVYRATGLAAADLGGKSDPFCVLELINARLQTQTEYKTLAPSWQKIFTFNVKDINSCLEVTVFDEDRDHKVEFLGKVAIPLLKIRNGEKRWYSLKDKKLHARAKGNYPMILLEMFVMWNPIRAWIRTLNPKEEKYMQAEIKFKRQVFVRNVLRLKAIIITVIGWGKLIQDCFEWERPLQSAIAFVLFIALCYYFEPYMILVALLLVFLKYYVLLWITGGKTTSTASSGEDEDEPLGDDDEDDEDKDKEEKKTLKERLQAIQEVTQTVQNAIGYIASLGEQVKNVFNFTVPFLSYLAIVLIFGAMIVLYFIPVRYLIMLFGVNKFARKLLRPHTIPNNEVLDLLSRVPDDEELIAFRELKQNPAGDIDRRREQRKKHKTS